MSVKVDRRRKPRKMTEHVTITMTSELLQALRDESDRIGITVAELSRQYLQTGLDLTARVAGSRQALGA